MAANFSDWTDCIAFASMAKTVLQKLLDARKALHQTESENIATRLSGTKAKFRYLFVPNRMDFA